MAELKPYRLKITDHNGYSKFIYRNKDGAVHMISSDEAPLALSNLLGKDAAEARFNLEDVPDGGWAAKYLRGLLDQHYVNNKPITPKVIVLS